MDKAKDTLDICIFSITNYDFALSILDAHKRGVQVRLVTDSYRVKASGSQMEYLISGEIPTRVVASGREMHHKFFVADKKTLVNCSFNWTMQAMTGNSEDAVILSESVIVKKYLGHFDILWNTATPCEISKKTPPSVNPT